MTMTVEELKQICAEVGVRRGWSFARMQVEREPVPWKYAEVARNYLKLTDVVLDVGTGGGERFSELAPFFAKGIGVDPDASMIQVARENAASSANTKISFVQLGAENLDRLGMGFDVVLNRHAVVTPEQIVRVLKSGGYFISQQVGAGNMQNFRDVLEPGNSNLANQRANDLKVLVEKFSELGCRIIETGEYNVKYWVKDIESLVFWLKAIDLPPGFNIEAHGERLLRLLDENTTSKGIVTNEHRQLLVVQM